MRTWMNLLRIYATRCMFGLWIVSFQATGQGEPAPALRVTPIAPELGLFDVTASGLKKSGEPAFILVERQGGPLPERFQLFPASLAPDTWTCRVMLGEKPALHAHVRIEGIAGNIELDLELPERERVPAWAMGAVWYQVFPERFRNGDPRNDPSGPAITTVPWTSDFSDVSIEEIERAWSRQRAGDLRSRANFDARGGARRATIYSRRYGGDLIGLFDAAAYIESLGVSALYLCPVFHSSSLHKYDAADYLHVDPTFGPPAGKPDHPLPDRAWSVADRYFVDAVLPAFRERRIRVVLDGVWNHTGTDHWAFRDLVKQGRESKHANWYDARFDESGELIGWQGWDAWNGNLPEFRQTEDGDLSSNVREHVFEITRRWMDPDGDGNPSDGIDGWRLDVAPEIGMAFWERWRSHVRAINPDAALIGEIWFDAGPWFGGRAFDAQMNYPFAVAVVEWCAGAPRTDSARLGERLARVFSHAPQNDLAQMNLLGSHDTTRLLTMLAHPAAAYDNGATASDLGRESLTVPPSREVIARMELAVAIQSLWLGSPMIYAGDEMGMYGPDDPDNRAPLPWPDAEDRTSGSRRFNADILKIYRRWFQLRSGGSASNVIRYGAAYAIPTDDPDVFAFCRTLNNERVVLVANRGRSEFNASDLLKPFIPDSPDARVEPLTARHFRGSAF